LLFLGTKITTLKNLGAIKPRRNINEYLMVRIYAVLLYERRSTIYLRRKS